MKPQVKGLRGVGHPEDTRYSAWERSHWYYRHETSEHGLGRCHPGDGGYVTPDTGSWGVSHVRFWTGPWGLGGVVTWKCTRVTRVKRSGEVDST